MQRGIASPTTARLPDAVRSYAERARLTARRFAPSAIGIRIPTRAEVEWGLPEGRLPYFRGCVTDLELD